MRTLWITGSTAAGVFVSAGFFAASAVAGSHATKVLTTELEGLEGLEANIVVEDVEPGWETPRHVHPGHVFVYVVDGTIEIEVDGEEPRKISAGEAVYESPNRPMVGRNVSTSEGARLVVFQVGPTGEPLMVEKPE